MCLRKKTLVEQHSNSKKIYISYTWFSIGQTVVEVDASTFLLRVYGTVTTRAWYHYARNFLLVPLTS